MNRADFAWALNAVLPHAGTRAQGLDFVNLHYQDGALFVYTMDGYTMGVARVNDGPMTVFDVALSVKEATDLMRFVRPGRVGERETPVDVLLSSVDHPDGVVELHVGFDNWEGEYESEVFDVAGTASHPLGWYIAYLRRLNDEQPIEDDLIVRPKLVEKFAKAAREDDDRLWILPRNIDERHGGAIVACGQNFVGAISGLTYDELGEATLASFLHPASEAA